MPGLPKWIPVWRNTDRGYSTNRENKFPMRVKVCLLLLFLVIVQAACNLPNLAKIPPTNEPTDPPKPSPTDPIIPTQTIPVPTQTAVVTENPVLSVTPTLTNTPEVLQTLEVQDENSEESIAIPKYTIKQSKPVLTGGESLVKDFNDKVDALYQEQIEEFTGMAEENEPWRAQNLPEFSSWLDQRYEMAYFSDELISLSIPIELYIAGMAHPNHFTRVINYDMINARTLQLGDIYQSEEQILPVLASYCKEELISRGELMFEEGILPEAANYQNWVITEQGFMVIFDPYQVAPYAIGTITVTIPWEVLTEEINPGGPLVRFLSRQASM